MRFLASLALLALIASPGAAWSIAAPVEGAPAPDEGLAPGVAPSAAPEEQQVEWGFPSALGLEAYPDGVAKVGDMVTFNWAGDIPHGVWRIPTGDCPAEFVASAPGSAEVFEEIGAPSNSGSATFAFDEPGTYWFACQVGTHCGGGMIIKYTVT